MAGLKIDQKSVTKVALFLGGYFLIARPILKKFGLFGHTPSVETTLENDAMKAALSASLRNSDPRPSYTTNSRAAAVKLNKAKGFFDDDENAIYGVFRNGHSLLFLSHVTYQFKNMYNEDLSTFLTDFLDEDEMNNIRILVEKLPVKK